MNFRAVGFVVACLGLYVLADGLGSIMEQPNQPFLNWQLVRVVRIGVGTALFILGLALVKT